MPYKGHKTITVTEDVESRLKALYENDKARSPTQSFSDYVEGILTSHLDYQKNLQEYGSFLKYDGGSENRISLFDSFLNDGVTVWIDGANKKLHCGHHKSDCCVHVGFCYAVKEVYDILIAQGFRPPRHIT